MNLLDQTFSNLSKNGKKAFVAYIGAGDPDKRATLEIMHLFVKNNVDVIELGVPFSDPIGDGPVNQSSALRALNKGTTIYDVLNIVKTFRKKSNTPVVLFSYFNPILQVGHKKFAKLAAKSGVSGVLVVDAPFDMLIDLQENLNTVNIHSIQLIAPTTEPERMKKIIEKGKGFIYYISSLGVTGTRKSFNLNIRHLKLLKKSAKVPVCIGFGISTPSDARKMAKYSDGIIIGSALVKIIEKNQHSRKLMMKELSSFTKKIVNAIRKT